MPLAPVRERLAPILQAGEGATCAIIYLEVLYSTRPRDYDRFCERRALARQGLQRAVAI